MNCICDWTRSKRRDDPKKTWIRRRFQINCPVHNNSNINTLE